MADTKFSQFVDGNEARVGDITVGLRAGLNYQFDFPGAGIHDSSNNKLLYWTSGGVLAVNYITITSALTGASPSISSSGTDANPNLTLATQGNGNLVLDPGGTGVISALASTRYGTGLGIQTGTTLGNTALFQAYNTGGAVYSTFGTLTAGSPPTLDLTVTTLNLTNPLPVTSGGTGTGTTFTAGSVIFAGVSGVYSQDNANFFWDDTNNRLGIGNAAPATPLHVTGTTASTSLQCGNLLDASGDLVLMLNHNSSPVNYLYMYNVATGNSPIFGTTGSDTNVGLIITTKAAGQISLSSTNPSPVIFTSGAGAQHSTTFAFADTAQVRTVTFPDASGTVAFTSGGSVNPGLENQLAYYAADGVALSGLTTLSSGVLVTDSMGAPSISTTVPPVTLTTPVIGSIKDSNGNTILTLSPSVNAVNSITMSNVATLNSPILGVLGPDSNIGLILTTKGTGQLSIQAGNNTPINIVSGTSMQHSASFAFNSSASSQTITFPDGNGTVAFVGDADFTWSTISGTSQAAAVDNGYVVGNAGLTTITLPATAAVGASIGVEGLGAAGWVLTAAGGQTIKIGTTTTSTAGSLASVAASDNVYVTCIVANTTWRVRTTNSAGLTVT